nr:uncharacterized protein LOC113820302 [Penaeus vannamei]XP_027228439.1 uncharacterized protein LOC113820302 [Penaeus vannamei]XP_027228440.1 uncharacterized protein LOC113820302 [Penaeus vannamei]
MEDEHTIVTYRHSSTSPSRNRADHMMSELDLFRAVSQEGNDLRRDMNIGQGRLEATLTHMKNDLKSLVEDVQAKVQRNQMEIRSMEQMKNDLKKFTEDVQAKVQRNQMEIRSMEQKLEKISKQRAEKDQKIKAHGLAHILTAQDLRSPWVWWLVYRGLVYATNRHQDGFSYAKLSLSWNIRPFLSCRQDEEPTSSAYAIKRTDVTGPYPKVVFLDVGGLVFTTRFHIRIRCNSKHALHFASLCTGELGYNFKDAEVIWTDGVVSFDGFSFTRIPDNFLNAVVTGKLSISEVVADPYTKGIVVAHCDEKDNLRSFSLRVNGHRNTLKGGTDYIIGSVKKRENEWLGNIQKHFFSSLSIVDCGTVLNRPIDKSVMYIFFMCAGIVMLISLFLGLQGRA